MHLVQNKTKISNIDFFKNALPMHLHRGLSSTKLHMIKLTYLYNKIFSSSFRAKSYLMTKLKKNFFIIVRNAHPEMVNKTVHVPVDLEFVAFVNMKSKNSNPLLINQLSVVKKILL